MDKLLIPKEADILHDEFKKLEDWFQFLEFIKENFNNKFLYVEESKFCVRLSLQEKDNYVKTNIYDAIKNIPTLCFTIYSSTLRALRIIGSFYYVVQGFQEVKKGLRFTTKEEAIAFVKKCIVNQLPRYILDDDIEIIGNDEIIVYRKEDFIKVLPLVVESIKQSRYSFSEITKEIILNEFNDCYVYFVWVSFEMTGRGYVCLDKESVEQHNQHYEESKEERVWGWGDKMVKVCDLNEAELNEIVENLKKY